MKINKHSFYLIALFVVYYILYILLVPTYENPDESRHLWSIFQDTPIFDIKGNGKLYNSYQRFFADLFGFTYKEEYGYKHVIKNLNTDFGYFKNEYRYYHSAIYPRIDIFMYRFVNILVLVPLFYWFLHKQNNRRLFAIALCFPGFVWFLTCFNPDIFNIVFSIIIFNLRHKSNFFILILLAAAFTLLDRSIILLLLALITSFFYEKIPVGKYYRIIFWILFIGLLAVMHDLSKNIIYYNFEYEPVKSVFTAVVSFYGLLGNMSIRATVFEYFAIFCILFFIVYRKFFLKNTNPKYNEIVSFSSVLLIYFVFWVYLIILVPTLDQGRYFFPVIFYLMYLINELVLKKIKLRTRTIIFISISLNFLMFSKLIYVFVKHTIVNW